ncbi:MAG: Na(+)-translocating NADH-quinone reductase subunit A [Planctomycetia bacterium]|nr:Na(+)-translocating NADH-quinone reductase subunit A [Planctomycetia bacterium]
MQKFTIRKGLNLPIAGEPVQEVSKAKAVRKVALVGPDYVGLRPTLAVAVGDKVKTGQLLFTDTKNPGVKFTSPGTGTVESIHRGDRRAFQSIVIKLESPEKQAKDKEPITFPKYAENQLLSLTRGQVVNTLVESGLWTAIRTRPYGKIPKIDAENPRALFITAMDTNPLAADAEVVISMYRDAFAAGLKVLSRLGIAQMYVCRAAGVETIPGEELEIPSLEEVSFAGPHPAGLPGTHIHFLAPVGRKHTAWYLYYQDVIAIGQLFLTGTLDVTRIVSLAGPRAKKPRLIQTRLGASLEELTSGEILGDDNRIVSGSVLNGRTASGALAYLGRYHHQISVLEEGDKRHLLGWVTPAFGLFSFKWVNISRLIPFKKFSMDTNIHGGSRAIIPIGSMEEVMPLDILPTCLLRSLSYKDLEEAEALGALELEEEDLALCTFVDPGKNDFGVQLRDVLTTIEKEG